MPAQTRLCIACSRCLKLGDNIAVLLDSTATAALTAPCIDASHGFWLGARSCVEGSCKQQHAQYKNSQLKHKEMEVQWAHIGRMPAMTTTRAVHSFPLAMSACVNPWADMPANASFVSSTAVLDTCDAAETCR